ncbi:hypothetical protein ACI79J_07515 [Geodermatophilus sp. SYSU D01062]
MLHAQFTYTASSRRGPFDIGAGWKVSAVAKDDSVSDDVIRRAARNVGGFVPPALPELASKADVDALPHCLRLDLLDGPERLVCLSSIVAAGPDYSGRPNLFAHGLVVSSGGLTDEREKPIRPADLWDADLWLRPLGTRAAEESQLDERLQDLTRGPLDDAALDAFTRAHRNQLELVLAAVERHLRGDAGPLVIVGDESFSSVATWVGLIGRLLLPASAWRLPFSTYERLRDARTANGWPFVIVGVPPADAGVATTLPGSKFAVVHDTEQPVRTSHGGWALHDGTELAAGPWARLAESVITSDFLPVVAEQVEALAEDVGATAVDKPLWALGAAVLLDEDLPESFGFDAAAVVADHWPTGLDAGTTFDRLLERVRELAASGSRAAEQLLKHADGRPDGVVAQQAWVKPVRTALTPPVDFAKHPLQGPLAGAPPAAPRELDEVSDSALEEVTQAADPVRALLEIAGQVDVGASSVNLRLRAVELAQELLVPRLLAPTTEPARRGWPPVPTWLWDALVPTLAETPRLEHGMKLPGQNLSAATHEWLASLSVPVGELTVEALRRTGPVERERAAYRLFVQRADITPLERAAAFLATVNSSAINENMSIDRWAHKAAEMAYPRSSPLDAVTAVILMEALPSHIPFASVLGAVLLRYPIPDATTQNAVKRLSQREAAPKTLEKLLERHQRVDNPEMRAVAVPILLTKAPVAAPKRSLALTEARTAPDEVLVATPKQLLPLLIAASASPSQSARAPVAEALLRVDVRALPMTHLPQYTWDRDMPWEDGWTRLDGNETNPGIRTMLAAHLMCRGARARAWPREDWASHWLTQTGRERHRLRVEAVAAKLLLPGDARIDVVALVHALIEQTPKKPPEIASDSERHEEEWRRDAVQRIRRLVAEQRDRPSPVKRHR